MLDLQAAELISPTHYQIRKVAKRFENWEQFIAGKCALKKAIDYALEWGLENIQERIYTLADYLREKLKTIKRVTNTDEGTEKCGIVTFTIADMQLIDLQKFLHKHKINISIAGGSGSLISFESRGIKEAIRASIHYYNTKEEIDIFVKKLDQAINYKKA